MFIYQHTSEWLGVLSYYIESNGEAIIIDPVRDAGVYLTLANDRRAQIKYIFETRYHSDFVSGHFDLSAATGAPIVFGPGATRTPKVTVAKDGDIFSIGGIMIKLLHTPGLSKESSCYLLYDENGSSCCLFSGDILSPASWNLRQDLHAEEVFNPEDQAAMLHENIREKILSLPDEVKVYPTHKNTQNQNTKTPVFTTLGEQKRTDDILIAPTKEVFTALIMAQPHISSTSAEVIIKANRNGYEPLDDLLKKGLNAMTAPMFRDRIKEETIFVLDTRNETEFTKAFISGSISIGLNGNFAEWVKKLVPYDNELLLVCDTGTEAEVLTKLATLGFSKMAGYLDGGIEAWNAAGEPIDMIIDISPDELAIDLPFDENLLVVDVRSETEFSKGHVKGAVNVPLHTLTDPASMSPIEDTDNMYIHCGSGYRSVIACSWLKKEGFHNLRNIEGGWAAIIKEKNIERE